MFIKLLDAEIPILLISISCIDGFFRREKWFSYLVNYIQHGLKMYQTIFITDGESVYGNSITNDIIIKITGYLPTKVISYKYMTSRKVLDLVKSGITYRRKTTLFITIQSLEIYSFYSPESDLIKILSHLSEKKTKPKASAIILSTEKRPSYGILF